MVSILPLLKRGIGIHHGGLLPILKEIIEILFQVYRRALDGLGLGRRMHPRMHSFIDWGLCVGGCTDVVVGVSCMYALID